MLAADSVHNPVAAILLFIFVILPFFWLIFGSMLGKFDSPPKPKVKTDVNMPLRDMRDGKIGKGRG